MASPFNPSQPPLPLMLYGRRRKFCSEYVRDFDARQAALRAGFVGISFADAGALLNDPDVAGEIERIVARSLAYSPSTLDDLVREAEKIAFADIGEVIRIDSAGAPRVDFSEASPESLAAVAGVEVKEYMEGRGEDAQQAIAIKVKFASKLDALKLLASLKKFDAQPPPPPAAAAPVNADELSPEAVAAEYQKMLRA